MIIITGTFEIDPADRECALVALTSMADASRTDPGCVTYGFWVDPARPDRFRAYEEWETAEAIGAHMATPHATAFRAALAVLRFRSSDVWRYQASRISRVG
ncbi:MAG: antibiotic biosynthesis monooxygenase [Actinobacteria bacterium]|nr:antibiotic biosynthesis monooxygenase [Actinomycetota bacterium]